MFAVFSDISSFSSLTSLFASNKVLFDLTTFTNSTSSSSDSLFGLLEDVYEWVLLTGLEVEGSLSVAGAPESWGDVERVEGGESEIRELWRRRNDSCQIHWTVEFIVILIVWN